MTMDATSTIGRFELSGSDFQLNQQTGFNEIILPATMDYSFSKNGELVQPDLTAIANENIVFSFSVLPDMLYKHEPIAGKDGRSLPIQQIIHVKALLHTDIDLKRNDPSPLSPRPNTINQNENVQMGVDDSCISIMVADHLAYSKENPFIEPMLSMKMPKNNNNQSTIALKFKMQKRSQYDELVIMPPLATECILFTDIGTLCAVKDALTQSVWDEKDSTRKKTRDTRQKINTFERVINWTSPYNEKYGYQYSIIRKELNPIVIKIYRNTDWGDANEYIFCIELSDALKNSLNENPNQKTYFKMRYADEKDDHERLMWKGWTPTIGFGINVPPPPPENLRVSQTLN